MTKLSQNLSNNLKYLENNKNDQKYIENSKIQKHPKTCKKVKIIPPQLQNALHSFRMSKKTPKPLRRPKYREIAKMIKKIPQNP